MISGTCQFIKEENGHHRLKSVLVLSHDLRVNSRYLPLAGAEMVSQAERAMSQHVYDHVVERLRKIQLMMGPQIGPMVDNEIAGLIGDLSVAVTLIEVFDDEDA